MTTAHTPEPWAFTSECGEIVPPVVAVADSGQRKMVCRMVSATSIPPEHPNEFEARSNGHRIVACVNAMSGIADPAAFVKSRADLLAACKMAYARSSGARDCDAYAEISWEALDAIEAAISRAEGAQP